MSEQIIVSTENGKIRGKVQKDYHGGTFYSFSGIPYAKPPTGELRFKAPQPAEPWKGVLDGTNEQSMVPQIVWGVWIYAGNEERCLNLNVYTKQINNKSGTKLPVMVYIHGGCFTFGSNTSAIYGPHYLLTEDIVLVNINYRLGVLGFLSLEDPSLGVPGNAGLKDQVMALKWVQNNIHNFGGDPNNVTVFGQSAGGVAVHYLTLSPLTKGLFHKAIIESGSTLNLWSKGRRNAADIAKVMGYDSNMDEKTILKKLMGSSARSIVNAMFRSKDVFFPNSVRAVCPVIEYPHEGAFITEDPEKIIIEGKNHQVPIMIGYSSGEGLLYEIFRQLRPKDAAVPHDLLQDIPYDLNIPPYSQEAVEITEKLKQFYFTDGDISNLHNRYKMFGDFQFIYGIQKTIRLLKQHNKIPVYAYKVSVMSSLNTLTMACQSGYIKMSVVLGFIGQYLPIFKRLQMKLGANTTDGICHGDEAMYLFSNKFNTVTVGSTEDLLIQKFVKVWTNFAKFSDPTPIETDRLDNVKWSPVSDEHINEILELGNKFKMIGNLEKKQVEFWDKLYEEYL